MPDTTSVAAECLGVKVQASRHLNETRIGRINGARYEGQEIAGALHIVKPDDIVLELGAGIGLVGAVIAHNAKPGKVHSFEANPELIPVINALYELNDLGDRISVLNQILISAAERPATMPFHVRNNFLGSSLMNPDNRRSTLVDVPTAGFNETCEALSPTVLVADIEGAELELLRHADLSCFRGVVIEFHRKFYGKEGMNECKGILQDAGFVKVDEKSTGAVWTCLRP